MNPSFRAITAQAGTQRPTHTYETTPPRLATEATSFVTFVKFLKLVCQVLHFPPLHFHPGVQHLPDQFVDHSVPILPCTNSRPGIFKVFLSRSNIDKHDPVGWLDPIIILGYWPRFSDSRTLDGLSGASRRLCWLDLTPGVAAHGMTTLPLAVRGFNREADA